MGFYMEPTKSLTFSRVFPKGCQVTIFQLLVESSTVPRIWQFQLRLSGVGLSKHWPLGFSKDLKGKRFHPSKLRETLRPLEYLPTRWWFQRCFIFTPTWGRFPFWRSYFSNGLKPPTSLDLASIDCNMLVNISIKWSISGQKNEMFMIMIHGLIH